MAGAHGEGNERFLTWSARAKRRILAAFGVPIAIVGVIYGLHLDSWIGQKVSDWINRPRLASRDYSFYFPFEQSVLTPEARAVAQDAAGYAKKAKGKTVISCGYGGPEQTDVGLAAAMALRGQRVESVRSELVARGVASSSIEDVQHVGVRSRTIGEPLDRRCNVQTSQ